MKYWLMLIALFFGLSAFNACTPVEEEEEEESTLDTATHVEKEVADLAEASIQLAEEYYDSVHAVLINPKGDRVGLATFTETSEGVQVEVDGWSLPPGVHGLHIHEHGSCEAPSFESAGGHYNPTEATHGFDHPQGPHAGDLPNIEVAEDGQLHVQVVGEMISIQEGAKNNILLDGGTSIMIHSQEDDYTSQPAGDAGERIACGIIQ
ncbi:MAG TPA: superoxide dismutase family protein [Bacillota bacterium]|nr:superoxide dismutase family protein [Bacillota bacterium]